MQIEQGKIHFRDVKAWQWVLFWLGHLVVFGALGMAVLTIPHPNQPILPPLYYGSLLLGLVGWSWTVVTLTLDRPFVHLYAAACTSLGIAGLTAVVIAGYLG